MAQRESRLLNTSLSRSSFTGPHYLDPSRSKGRRGRSRGVTPLTRPGHIVDCGPRSPPTVRRHGDSGSIRCQNDGCAAQCDLLVSRPCACESAIWVFLRWASAHGSSRRVRHPGRPTSPAWTSAGTARARGGLSQNMGCHRDECRHHALQGRLSGWAAELAPANLSESPSTRAAPSSPLARFPVPHPRHLRRRPLAPPPPPDRPTDRDVLQLARRVGHGVDLVVARCVRESQQLLLPLRQPVRPRGWKTRCSS